MADKTFSLATDSLQLHTDGITESDGIISVPATIAKHMIQDYDGLKVLKPATELEAAAGYADGIPVTRDHPPAGIVTDRGEVLGFLKSPLFENDELKGILEIADKDLATDVKDGKLKELSVGFFCNLDRSEGTVGDAKYDAIQKDIFLNHVAVVDAGRCSLADGCGIHTDSKPAPDTASELATITAERDALKTELEKTVKIEKDAIIAELTSAQDAKTADDLSKLKLDELKKELDMVNELRTDRLSFGKEHDSEGKSAVDDAYAKVGR
jgi:hypothetical protein